MKKPRHNYILSIVLLPLAVVLALASRVVWAETTSIRLSNGETLTYQEFERVLHLEDIGLRGDEIREQIGLAGAEIAPLCRQVLAQSEQSLAVARALNLLRERCAQVGTCEEDAALVVARPGMMRSPDVQGQFLDLIDEHRLGRYTDTVIPWLDAPKANIRRYAFHVLVRLGGSDALALLERRLPDLRQRDIDEMEQKLLAVVDVIPEGGPSIEDLRAEHLVLLETRWFNPADDALDDMRARIANEAEDQAESTTSIRLSNGETLTAEEVEFGLDWHANGHREQWDPVQEKMALADKEIVPLLRRVAATSGYNAPPALALLQKLELDKVTAADIVDAVAGNPGVFAVGGVQGQLISFMATYELASHVDTLIPLLESDRNHSRWEAFKFMALHGDESTLALLEERLPLLREREIEELDEAMADLRKMVKPGGADFDRLRVRSMKTLDSRYSDAESALAAMRVRPGLAPAGNAVPQQDRILFEGDRGILTYSELVERFSHPDNSHTDEGVATEYKIAEAGDQLIPVWVELLRTSDRPYVLSTSIYYLLDSSPDPEVHRDDLLAPFKRGTLSSPGTLIRVLESVGRPEDVEMLYPLLLHPESSRVRLHAARVLAKIGDASTLAHLESLRESLISLYEADLESADKTRADLIGAGWNTAFVERAVRDRGSWLIWATDGVDSAVPALRQRLETPEATPIPWTIVIGAAVGLLAVVAGVVAVQRRRHDGPSSR